MFRLFNKWHGMKTIGYIERKVKLDHFSHYTQQSVPELKWIKNLNMERKSIKFLDDNTGIFFIIS